MSVILGINAYHAGASAAIVVDGEPKAAIAEERLNRKKYYAEFPSMAITRCLEMAGVGFEDIDAVAIGRDASANRNKKIEYMLKNPSKLLNLLKIKASREDLDDLKTLISKGCGVDASKLRFQQHNVEHHLAHIASAYFCSPYDKAAGFSVDGSGDFVTTMLADCEGDEIRVLKRVYVPHSLGSLYTMICQFIGYDGYGDEGKVMGLAPYGKDSYEDIFNDMVTLTADGFTLNAKYFMPFGSNQGLSMDENGAMVLSRHYSDHMIEKFGPPRDPGVELSQRDMDLAFGVQHLFEKVYVHMLKILEKEVQSDKLCIAGGCALNSVVNGKIFDQTGYKETYIQPAAGDEGLSLGAAMYVSRSVLKEGKKYHLTSSYMGPEYNEEEIKQVLDAKGVCYERCEREELLDKTTEEMVKGNVVGWFQGQMEWGPRALGNRSIVVHPGLPDMKDVLNARIKRREWYRPFAPSVMAERQSDIFEHEHPSPFMLHVYKIKPEWREKLCAVNHVDNTGRLQSVSRDENPLYYDLISTFEKKTGIPVILNTSFNENEPIVCRPEEAVECFLRTKMDVLSIGPFVCRKTGAQ